MENTRFDVNRLRVASPCPISWESMTGSERSRHCSLCRLTVHNISELTPTEVESLVTSSGERLCIRIYRRADGTISTKDCPVGLRGYRKRVARIAGAAFGAVLSLFSVVSAQKDKSVSSPASAIDTVSLTDVHGSAILMGSVVDANGAVIPNVEVLLFKKGEKTPKRTISDEKGMYRFDRLTDGLYQIVVEPVSGFTNVLLKTYELKAKKLLRSSLN